MAQVRSEQNQGEGDDSALNDLKMFCSGDQTWHGGNEGYWGDWTEEDSCPQDQAICGIQTKVQDSNQEGTDLTAMNVIKFRCCYLPLPCVPTGTRADQGSMIEPGSHTSFGNWGEIEFCPEGHYVSR